MRVKNSLVAFTLLTILTFVLFSAHAQAGREQTDATLSIQIQGNGDQLLKNAKAHLSLSALEDKQVPSIFRVRYLARQGEREIATALEPYGFYNASISHEVIEAEEQWTVSYKIDIGPVTTYAEIKVQLLGRAKKDTAFIELLNKLQPKLGEPLVHERYESLKSGLRNLAAERGYYDAHFTRQKLWVERTTQTATLALEFDSGPRYLFGDTVFCCSFLDDSLLNRFMQYQPGEYFNTRDLLDLQVDLAGSEYFKRVEIAPRWESSEDGKVDIDVTLEPNKRNRYQYGLGYGTDTGARVTLGFDRRWVNTRGHRLSSVLRLSEVQNTGYVSYQIPGNDPARDAYSFNGEVTDRSYEQQRSTLYRATMQDLRHYDRWHRIYQLAYQREKYAFGDGAMESSSFLIPSIEWSLIESSKLAQNRNIVDDGYRLSFLIQGAHDSVMAATTFASLKVSGKWVHRLDEQWRVLARGEVGVLKADDFEQLGPTLRFFAGGDHSVRGYAFQQLGPENQEGVVLGGRYLVASSIEVDYAINQNWRLALFTDLGNSMMDWNESLKQSIGFGVRWVSPIGPVRLDLAQAIDEPSKPWRIHLTLGPDL